ncbi:metallophosphoesterase [Wolbachia endosymbiont of Pentidionis agamae]|uniref:metallophosphoesterase n=1 Tax=Wolbachia endosymbiont of Pentidionis agamae TaxID=3110435 RepID=UPI002FD179AE
MHESDSFKSWKEELLEPSANILQKFPMLFIRGNHENCDYCSLKTNNAYKSWYRYFDIGNSVPKDNVDMLITDNSWIFNTGSLQFYVLDSSYCGNDDYSINHKVVSNYEKKFAFFNAHANPKMPYWLVTHKTFWNYNGNLSPSEKHHSEVNEDLLLAFNNIPIKNISAILSGHIHMAQILLMDSAPTQIISGNSGGLLYNQDLDPVMHNIEFHTSNRIKFYAKKALNFPGFGFAILDLENRKFSFYSKDNKELYSAELTENFSFNQ